MASFASRRLVITMCAAMSACTPVCADHSVGAIVDPQIVMRDVDTTLSVTFTADVLTDADAAQQLVVRLGPPNNAPAVAIWSGGMLSSGAGLSNVGFTDPRRLHLTVHIAPTYPAGDYSLDITTEGSGGCLGPSGTVTLRVQ